MSHYRVSKDGLETERRLAPHGKYELVAIAGVGAPRIWNEARAVQLREAMRKKIPLPPVRLHQRKETRHPDGRGEWIVADGIHRINVSAEFGYTHVPALVTRDPKISADRLVVYGKRGPSQTVKTWFVARGDAPEDVIVRRPSREKAVAFAEKVAKENLLKKIRETGDEVVWSSG